ncbi:2-hydroxychromene-2-carboxylate isomerase [Oceanicella actignis]|uniref:2-hydroxychromene-2-carboxylate isomerase n=1 Tax=Oceanicella actignis TaxID=1189325 RepID=A0A1M7TSL0_9RHOB|nr:2-hydroxychromene-2-carboxylate isomerase [Oceanicella actignis]TYO85389.1 2-hydroxychromene-2-carboxylate isomerase [Oceanicella actignis]SET76531.1 2-hydroxychromene-2-carboxylate isomerase [Oceanicella actignis]SHN73705.1 2-hydroxychromene-2-carboxylate isomerase [Oceanicella actignis]
MTKTFEFLFDFGSPASYLAWARLPALERRTGARARLRPILLGAVFKATGNASPAMIPAKGRWMMQDLAMWAARHGTPFRVNPHFPVNTMALMRGAAALADDEPRLRAWCEACFAGMWRDGLNMADPDQAAAALAPAGFGADELRAMSEDPAAKQRLRAETESAVARGVFGAPTFFVGERMFFGQDRMDFVEEALA